MLEVEKDVEGYLVRQVEKLGGRCLKFVPLHEKGMPDRIVILGGNIIAFVETKRPKGGHLTEIQKYQINKLKKLGCHVYVAKNKLEIDELLKELTDET